MPTIHDESGDRAFFTLLPNIIFSMDLSPYALALYAHLKRVAGDTGVCYQSTETLATACRMSVGQISETKPELVRKGLIEIREEPRPNGGRPSHHITIKNIWGENADQLARLQEDKRQRDAAATATARAEKADSPHEQATSPHELASSQHEVKKIPSEEPYINKPEEDPPDDRQQAWRELSDLLMIVSGTTYQRFQEIWDDFPDPRRHRFALEQTKKYANPVSFRYYETTFLRYDPDKPKPPPRTSSETHASRRNRLPVLND